jgi:predicted MFS family arabinose efflux permease
VFYDPAIADLDFPAPMPVARPVALLGALKLVVNTAFRFAYPFLPAIGRGLGIELDRAGMLLSVRWMAGLFSPLLLGASGAGRKSRRVILGGVTAFAIGSLITAATGVFWGAVAGFAVLGFAKPLIDIGAQTYVSARVPYSSRARHLGLLELAWAGGLLVGGPLAGWLIDTWGWRAPFWVLGAIAVIGTWAATRVLEPGDDVGTTAAHIVTTPAYPRIAGFLAGIALIGFGHESVLVVLGSWLERDFGLTLLALGGIGTLLGLAELVGEGSMVAFTDRIGKVRSMTIGIVVGGTALVVLSFVASTFRSAIPMLLVTMAGLEFGYIAGFPLASELRPQMRARVLGWMAVATGCGRIVADLLTPRVFGAGGMPLVARIAASAFGLAALLVSRVREAR